MANKKKVMAIVALVSIVFTGVVLFVAGSNASSDGGEQSAAPFWMKFAVRINHMFGGNAYVYTDIDKNSKLIWST